MTLARGAGWSLLVLAAALLSLATGPLAVAPADVIAAASGEGSRDAELALAIRGPRVLTALVVGAALAAAGAALQTVFRSPLVAPDLLGVSSGRERSRSHPTIAVACSTSIS